MELICIAESREVTETCYTSLEVYLKSTLVKYYNLEPCKTDGQPQGSHVYRNGLIAKVEAVLIHESPCVASGLGASSLGLKDGARILWRGSYSPPRIFPLGTCQIP